MTSELPYIRVAGTHREVGRQIGEAERDLVALGLAYYQEQFPTLAGFDFAEAMERAGVYLAAAERHTPQIVEQLRGIAEGAAVPFEHVFTVNCCEELTCVPQGAEHCTTFAFASGGRVVAAHNEDWYPGDIRCLVVRHVTMTDGFSYLSVGPAGYLPITSITSYGICGGANTLYSYDVSEGVPNNLVLASLLSSRDLDEFQSRLTTLPRARGSNHLLCDARGRIRNIETTATRLAAADGGASYVHTNHYLEAELLPYEAYRSPGTPKRFSRATELLASGLAAGTDAVALARSIQRDHANAPYSICAHWDDSDPAQDQSVTTASMVWEPAEGQVHVAVGPPCEHEYVTYTL